VLACNSRFNSTELLLAQSLSLAMIGHLIARILGCSPETNMMNKLGKYSNNMATLLHNRINNASICQPRFFSTQIKVKSSRMKLDASSRPKAVVHPIAQVQDSLISSSYYDFLEQFTCADNGWNGFHP
jgi:hypothetical protein